MFVVAVERIEASLLKTKKDIPERFIVMIRLQGALQLPYGRIQVSKFKTKGYFPPLTNVNYILSSPAWEHRISIAYRQSC